MKRITRRKLFQIVRKAVNSDSKLTVAQRDRLEEVARTVDTVLLNAWYKDGCGCIVGTVLKRTPLWRSPYYDVSIAIDRALLKHTGIKLLPGDTAKLTVIG